MGDLEGAPAELFNLPLLSFYLYTTFKTGIAAAGVPIPSEWGRFGDCLSLKKMYSLYSLWMFPHCLSVASEAQLRIRKGCMQFIASHDKKDHAGETNVLYSPNSRPSAR